MTYDVAIIGGGPAGYTAAEKAGKGGLSTILFEKNALGGVCLNEGCVPTKTLLYSAKVYDTIKHAPKYAVSAENATFDYAKIIARKNKVVKKLTAGIPDLHRFGDGHPPHPRISRDGILDEPRGVAMQRAPEIAGHHRRGCDWHGIRLVL